MRKAVYLSYLYSLLSLFLGPALVAFSSKDPSGWDCSDPSWYRDGVPLTTTAQREAIYEHDARFMVPVASIMVITGVLILIYMYYRAVKTKNLKHVIAPTLLMAIVLFGYWMIIAVASSGWC